MLLINIDDHLESGGEGDHCGGGDGKASRQEDRISELRLRQTQTVSIINERKIKRTNQGKRERGRPAARTDANDASNSHLFLQCKWLLKSRLRRNRPTSATAAANFNWWCTRGDLTSAAADQKTDQKKVTITIIIFGGWYDQLSLK